MSMTVSNGDDVESSSASSPTTNDSNRTPMRSEERSTSPPQFSASASIRYFSPTELYTGKLTERTPQIIIDDVQKSLGVSNEDIHRALRQALALSFVGSGRATESSSSAQHAGSSVQLNAFRSQQIELLNSHFGIPIDMSLIEQNNPQELTRLARVLNPHGWKGHWTWHKLRTVLAFLDHAATWTSIEIVDNHNGTQQHHAFDASVMSQRQRHERVARSQILREGGGGGASSASDAAAGVSVASGSSSSSALMNDEQTADVPLDFEPYVYRRLGFPTPQQVFSLPRWILYRICSNNHFRTTSAMTERQLTRACELFGLESNQLQQIARASLTETLSTDLVSFILDTQHSMTINHTPTNFAELVYANTQLSTAEALLCRVGPETDAEAVVLAASLLNRDISCSRTPQVDYAYMRAGLLPKDTVLRRIFVEDPTVIDTTVSFNPDLPENLYKAPYLVHMCRNEGINDTEIIREGPYVLLQQSWLLDTFNTMQNFLPSGEPITYRNTHLLVSLDTFESAVPGSILLFGPKASSERLAVGMEELAMSFMSNKSFTNPFERREQPFSATAIAKLRTICSNIIREHHASSEMSAGSSFSTPPAPRARPRAVPPRLNIPSSQSLSVAAQEPQPQGGDHADQRAPAASAAASAAERIVTRSIARALQSANILFIQIDGHDEEQEEEHSDTDHEEQQVQAEQQVALPDDEDENNDEIIDDEEDDDTVLDEENEDDRTTEVEGGGSIANVFINDPPLVALARRLTLAIDCVETLSSTQFSALNSYVKRYGQHDQLRNQCLTINRHLLHLGMFMRGWDGRSEGQMPVASTPTVQQTTTDVRVTEAWARFDQCIIQAGRVGQEFLDLPLIRWRGEFVVSRQRYEGKTIRERLEIIRRNTTQESCIRLSSNWLCATSHRISTAFGEMPPFSIELLRDIA